MSLSEKQRRFVDEYLIDLNGTQAAIRAGYSPRTANEQAARLLAKVSIQTEVKRLKAIKAEENKVTADRIIEELALIAFADMGDFASVNDDGAIQFKRFDQLPARGTRIIKKIKESITTLSKGDDCTVIQTKPQLELHDKMKALELLGKHFGLFNDKKPEAPEAGPDPLLDAIGDSASADWSEPEDEPDDELTESDLPADENSSQPNPTGTETSTEKTEGSPLF